MAANSKIIPKSFGVVVTNYKNRKKKVNIVIFLAKKGKYKWSASSEIRQKIQEIGMKLFLSCNCDTWNRWFAPYPAFPTVQNADQPQTPLRSQNSGRSYQILMPLRRFEPGYTDCYIIEFLFLVQFGCTRKDISDRQRFAVKTSLAASSIVSTAWLRCECEIGIRSGGDNMDRY